MATERWRMQRGERGELRESKLGRIDWGMRTSRIVPTGAIGVCGATRREGGLGKP